MKKFLPIIIFLLALQITNAQESSFKTGEWFKFKMSYSGFLKAGNATLQLNETVLDGKPVYHVRQRMDNRSN